MLSAEARAWRRAAEDPAIAAELESVYQFVAGEIASRGPVCWASGRCCNFEAAGHRLYVTGLEAAYTLRMLDERSRASMHTSEARAPDRMRIALPVLGAPAESTNAIPPLDENTLREARERGGCPFQIDNLCGIHTIKPLGCRVYFCDESAQEWQHDLHERALAEVKALHDRRAIPYFYAEWRAMLAEALGARH